MSHHEISTFSKRITILIGLGVVSAMAFGLAVSFYRNLLFEETLDGLSQRNRTLRARIDDELANLAYYQSLQYRDKYAKENLGKLNAGEKVLILTDGERNVLPGKDEKSISHEEEQERKFRQYLENLPTPEHWRLYLFAPEELREMKRSF